MQICALSQNRNPFLVRSYSALLLLTALLLTSCQTTNSSLSDKTAVIPEGKIVELKTGKTISKEELIQQLVTSGKILVGETHDQNSHHDAELWLVKELQQRHNLAAVALEMLKADQQISINQAKSSASSLSDNEIRNQINWDNRWSWRQYGPMVLAAMHEPSTALVATNLTDTEIKVISAGQNQPLAGKTSVSPDVKKRIAAIVGQFHGQSSGPMIDRMVEVQQFRDRRMAEKLAKSRAPAILIAGRNHVDRQFGAPKHLEELAPTQKFSVLILSRNGEQVNPASGDFVWFIP